MQNKQGIIQMYILIICLLMNGCCSYTSIGPFVKLPMEMKNPEKDSIQPISIFHEENNKIYSMDYSDSFQNIDCFDWDGYRKYIEAPVNRYEVNSIALVIDQDEAISNSPHKIRFSTSIRLINQIRKMFSNGMGQREIARFLCISRNTVARYLAQNPGAPGNDTRQSGDATHGKKEGRTQKKERQRQKKKTVFTGNQQVGTFLGLTFCQSVVD